MRKLLNTLFILSEDVYCTVEGENIVILREQETVGRFPFHTLENILCFSYKGASPALLGACASRGIAFSFFSPRGKYLCSTSGITRGNVLLRRTQYRVADQQGSASEIASRFLFGKVCNGRCVLRRGLRDHKMRMDAQRVEDVTVALGEAALAIEACRVADELRGLEGAAAKQYFSVFNELVLQNEEEFAFTGRSRRPPQDRINAALSFVYTLLAGECAAALEGVGLDPYVGFLHTDRPGRASLALDLMEELRPIMADRFILTLVNTRELLPKQFDLRENGSVYLNDSGRKTVLTAWQAKKREEMMHPYLKEKIAWGLVPHAQALLLARFLRGDLDGYPPFLWR